MGEQKRTEVIGKVKIRYLTNKYEKRYADSVEDELMELFRHPDPDKKRQEILNNNPSWEQYYHLSPYRGAVVNWFDFKEGASVLEVGAGTGAVTESLVKLPLSVAALDMSLKRSLINAARNQQSENLEIMVGNLEQLKAGVKYDYVVCIGVLEYAGSFITHQEPYKYFLELIREHLKPGGSLILAIENRLGLKYWAGAREDHTGGFFDGINNYPGPKRVQTFGKKELERLVKNAGFKDNMLFFYPYPDYKNPHIIYSDEYYPGNGAEFPLASLPTPTPGQSRVVLFSEAMAMKSLEDNDLFREMANSFIVVAENG